MAYKKKCFVGAPFDSLQSLLDWIDSGLWVFIRERAYHPSFVSNRLLVMVRGEQKEGLIRECRDELGEPYSTWRLAFEYDEPTSAEDQAMIEEAWERFKVKLAESETEV